MMRIEHWERTTVSGSGENVQAAETVLHVRGADALGMAMRRNQALAGCSRIEMLTEEAFTVFREQDETRRRKDISRDDRSEEWDW